MQESIVFLVRVKCRRKESSRSLSHLLMSFLSLSGFFCFFAEEIWDDFQKSSGNTACFACFCLLFMHVCQWSVTDYYYYYVNLAKVDSRRTFP